MWTVQDKPHKPAILVAEDDRFTRQLLARALRPAYHIVPACNAREAVRTAAQHHEHLDLLLTETWLPGQFGGWQLLELLKLDYPKIKVVYVSKSIDAEIKAHTQHDKVLLWDYPFPKERLRQAVRETLENPASNGFRSMHGTSLFLARLRNYLDKFSWSHRTAS